MDSEKIIANLLNFNFKIENGFFKKTKFCDNELEDNFQNDIFLTVANKKNVSNLLILLGYVATLVYILFVYYKTEFLIICISCFFMSLLSIILSLNYKSRKAFIYHNHFQVFLSSMNLTLKGLLVCLKYNNDSTDNYAELLRIIIYDFVSTNIYLLTKLESDIRISLYYFLQSLCLMTCAIKYSNRNHFYYLEGMTSFFVYLIFYCLRKEWDYKLRCLFLEKIKFKYYFNYTLDFLDGLNAFNVNVQNDNNIFYNEKFYNAVSHIITNFNLECHIRSNDNNIFINNNNNNNQENCGLENGKNHNISNINSNSNNNNYGMAAHNTELNIQTKNAGAEKFRINKIDKFFVPEDNNNMKITLFFQSLLLYDIELEIEKYEKQSFNFIYDVENTLDKNASFISIYFIIYLFIKLFIKAIYSFYLFTIRIYFFFLYCKIFSHFQ